VRESKNGVRPTLTIQAHTKNGSWSCDYGMGLGQTIGNGLKTGASARKLCTFCRDGSLTSRNEGAASGALTPGITLEATFIHSSHNCLY
jgi:hypothetical protein